MEKQNTDQVSLRRSRDGVKRILPGESLLSVMAPILVMVMD